jgi:IS30 family transposase
VAKGFSTVLKRFKSQMRLSMTYDQGTEMSSHKTLTKTAKVAEQNNGNTEPPVRDSRGA